MLLLQDKKVGFIQKREGTEKNNNLSIQHLSMRNCVNSYGACKEHCRDLEPSVPGVMREGSINNQRGLTESNNNHLQRLPFQWALLVCT